MRKESNYTIFLKENLWRESGKIILINYRQISPVFAQLELNISRQNTQIITHVDNCWSNYNN